MPLFLSFAVRCQHTTNFLSSGAKLEMCEVFLKKKSFIFWWIKQESDGTITLLPTMRWTYSLSCNNLTVREPTVSFLKGNVLFILNVASFIPLFSARLIDVYWTESKALEFRVWLCLIWINIYLNFRIFISHRYTFFPKCFGKWDWDRDIKEQGLNIFFLRVWGWTRAV